MNDASVKISENTREAGIKKRSKNLKPFKKGKSGNPGGKPVGTRNFATIYRAAIEKLAKKKGITPDEFETDFLLSGLERSGKDFRFYKDTLDRKHGTPKQTLDLKGGEDIGKSFNEDQMKRIAGEMLNKKK